MRKKRGFTLLEVLLATLITAVGVTALVWAFSSGLFATTDIENVDLALNIAQAQMEVIKNTPYANLAGSGPTADSKFPNFNVTVTVAPGPSANQLQVAVTVSWNVKGGSTSLTLTTLVTKPCALTTTKCPA